MTEENTQKALGWFGQPANKVAETTTIETEKKVDSQITDAVTTKNETQQTESKKSTDDFEKRFNDTRKAFQKTKNKTLYANGQFKDIEADFLALKEYLGGADIDDDPEVKTKFDSIYAKINDGKRVLTTDDIDLSDVEEIAKKITEEIETTDEEKLLKEIDTRIKSKIDDYSEFKKDNDLKDKIDAFYQLFNKSSEQKQKEYLVMLKSNNTADIIDFMAEEGGDYIQNVVSPIKKHGNATQYISSLTKTIEQLTQENSTLKQELENRGTSKLASIKPSSTNNITNALKNSDKLGWFGK